MGGSGAQGAERWQFILLPGDFADFEFSTDGDGGDHPDKRWGVWALVLPKDRDTPWEGLRKKALEDAEEQILQKKEAEKQAEIEKEEARKRKECEEEEAKKAEQRKKHDGEELMEEERIRQFPSVEEATAKREDEILADKRKDEERLKEKQELEAALLAEEKVRQHSCTELAAE